MNKQRNILFRKLSLRTLPNLLFGSVRLLSKNLKSGKKSKKSFSLGFHFTRGTRLFNLHGPGIEFSFTKIII